MKCMNCNREIPDDAKICRFCEAVVEPEPTSEQVEIVQAMLAELPPEALAEFCAALAQSNTAEDFANHILVGPCPRCGSDQTGNVEHDPDIDDISIGRCYECGQLWCCLCDKLLDPAAPFCRECDEAWAEFGDDLE